MTTRPSIACSELSTDGRLAGPSTTADLRYESTVFSRPSTGRSLIPGASQIDNTESMSSSTQPAASFIAPSVVPLALMAIVVPSGDWTDVLPPPPWT